MYQRKKKETQIKYIKNVKITDCIYIIQAYIINYTEIKSNSKGPASKMHRVLYYETAFLNIYSSLVLNILSCIHLGLQEIYKIN